MGGWLRRYSFLGNEGGTNREDDFLPHGEKLDVGRENPAPTESPKGKGISRTNF
jgi:hypothetical protein